MLHRSLSRLVRLRGAASRLVHTSPQMAEEFVEKLKQENPYYSKYAGKISKLQEVSAEELERRVELKNRKDKVERDVAASSSFSATQPKAAATAPAAVRTKMLDDVIKLDLIRDKSSEEIGRIWTQFFQTKDSVSAIIPADQYREIADNAQKYPTFLFPLPREQGYEFVVAQCAGTEVHFTPLINYQAYKENAPECMTMVHYTELAEDKGIVLMTSEYDKSIINAREAQCLANELQLYYCRPDERRRHLLEQFTTRPDQFRYQDLVTVLEDIQLS